LIEILQLKEIDGGQERPVVFVSLYEHHSNLLPWRESACEVVQINNDPVTQHLDLKELEMKLKHYKG
jgi:selenocysteine lyase/cysteine desulfurase